LTNNNSYFACANTCLGFINYFDNILNSQNLEKIYIIKSYSGSSVLKELAKISEEKKYSVEYFLYPLNPERLNGIIIKELKTAIIDENLNMHKPPALIENIINFNDFYDEPKLIRRKKEIFELNAKKNEYLILAYKFLKAANELCENNIELSKKYINYEKLDFSVDRLINKYVNEKHLQEKRKNNCADEYRFINTVSAVKNIEPDVFESDAKEIFYISNENFLGWIYTKIISEKFAGLCKVICPDALNPYRIRAIFLKEPKVLFFIKNKDLSKNYDEKYHFINMERFTDINLKKENKQKLRFIQKCYKSLMDEAIKYFKEAEAINLAIENIYASAFNTNEKNKYTEAIIKKILP